MTRVSIKALDTGTGPARVGDVVIGLSETRDFDVPEGGITVQPSGPIEVGPPTRDIAPGQHDNPNGIQRPGIIAPKMPKPGGHTQQVVAEGGRIVERAVAEDEGLVLQGGGPESEAGETPGLTQEEMDEQTVPEEVAPPPPPPPKTSAPRRPGR